MKLKPAINQMLVPEEQKNYSGRVMALIKYVTIHTTGNYSPTATAEAHARFQFNGGSGKTSWHYTVDEKEIWQSFNDNQVCWHTGTDAGNQCSIGIEICVNNPTHFILGCMNAAALTAYLLDKHSLTDKDIKQHYGWSGKNCPAELRGGHWGVNWQEFLKMVDDHLTHHQAPSPWAENAWAWATTHRILDGTGPQGHPTREMLAQMLYNYHQYMAGNKYYSEP